MDNENVEIERHGDGEEDVDRSSVREFEMAGYSRDDERTSTLYQNHTLTIPRKPVQKSISSHFREDISPTSPTAPTGITFPDIEMVSPESLSERSTNQENTGHYLPDFDFVSPQSIRAPTPEPSSELPAITEEPSIPARPLSFVSGIEDIRYEAPTLQFDARYEAIRPAPAGDNEYDRYQSIGSQDDLLKTTPANTKDTSNWFSRHSADWWLVEWLSFFLSLLAVVAIIIILKVYDGQPLPKWPHSITLNSLLAIFITLAQVGLIIPISSAISQLKWIWFKEAERPLIDFETFDQASRGPIGSVKLLGQREFGNLAGIGAIISIMALASSPMTQQIISYREHLAPATSALAQASRSDIFKAYNPIQGSSGVPELSMQQAVKMGLLNAANESITASTPSCPSGNCTWPDFSSLGICSKVANVTSFLNVSPVASNLSTVFDYVINNNVTLPNGACLQAGEMSMNITSPSNMVNGSSVSPVKHSLAFANELNATQTAISDYFVIWQNNERKDQGGFGAVEVLLYWCVHTYSMEVRDGISNTTISSTSVNIGSTSTSEISMNPSNNSTNYTVQSTANAALMDYMARTFRGIYGSGAGGGYSTDAAQALVSALYDEPSLTNMTGQALDNMQLSGVQNLTQNIATSMTNNIRNRQSAGAPAMGTSWVLQTYVHVSWPWLSFLLILLVSTFAFLLATIIKTRAAKVDVMGSSTLATMLALSQEMKDAMGPVDMRGLTRERAQGLRVRLERGERGWSLEGRGKGEMLAT